MCISIYIYIYIHIHIYIYIYIILTSWRGWRLLVAPPVWVCIKRPWYRQVIRHIKNLCISNDLLRVLHWNMGVLIISIICVLILSVYTSIWWLYCFFCFLQTGSCLGCRHRSRLRGSFRFLTLIKPVLWLVPEALVIFLAWNGWEMGEIHV